MSENVFSQREKHLITLVTIDKPKIPTLLLIFVASVRGKGYFLTRKRTLLP